MNLHNASIKVSAVSEKQYPTEGYPEFAFAGRSNVGKSSMINKLLNRKSLARVSSEPGKTATINFYNIDDTIYLVDLPGYGYAKRPKAEKEKWGKMMEDYLANREQLVQTILLVDSRHKPTADDIMMAQWIRHYHDRLIAIATKTDKLKKREVETNLELIYNTLEMTEEEAVNFFSAVPKIHKKLSTLFDVGLGYVELGQSATTLSGGEAQRVKLATELAKPATGRTIYILDEPTTGLHTADVHRLIEVLQKLVDKGNTVLVIEHNLDVIKTADHVIDLGPDGGDKGGNIVAEGTPEQVAKVKGSYTGEYLKKVL